MNEDQKYQIIKKLVETKGSIKRAALKLNVSQRHVYRLIDGYIKEGKSYFVHGNEGPKPSNFVSEELRETVLKLYEEKYYGANFTHFKELLEKSFA